MRAMQSICNVIVMLLVSGLPTAIPSFADNEESIMVNQALALRREGKYDEAIALLKKALTLDPHDSVAFHDLGLTYCSKHDYVQGKVFYQEAVKINPHFVQAWNGLGVACKNLNDLTAAELALKRALALNPKYFSTLVNLSNLYQKWNRWKEARTYCAQANALPEADLPENKDVRDDLAMLNKRIDSRKRGE